MTDRLVNKGLGLFAPVVLRRNHFHVRVKVAPRKRAEVRESAGLVLATRRTCETEAVVPSTKFAYFRHAAIAL